MLRHRLYALPFLLILLSACQTLGLEKPTEFPDRVAYAYALADGAVTTATNALNAKAISSSDAKYVREAAVSTRTLIVAAEAAFGEGDVQSAEGRLALAEGVLRQLQTYLASKGVKS
jgi:hypothetical protein